MISTDNLTVRFGGLTAVNEVSLQVQTQAIYSLIGPNGAGKTTVFNVLSGFYKPSSGHISVGNERINSLLGRKDVIQVLVSAIILAIFCLTAFNIQSLWDRVIISNYIYLEPFHWGIALKSGLDLFVENLSQNLFIFLMSFLVAAAGAYAVIKGAKICPERYSRLGISRTFQNVRLFKQMSVIENILVAIEARRQAEAWSFVRSFLPKVHKQNCEEAQKLLALVGLSGKENIISSNLPYGHQRRLEIARALARQPLVLLLDEPAAGMNPSESVELLELIRKIRDLGITVILIEHDVRLVMNISDRVAVLDYGNKIAEGTPHEVQQDARVIEAYLGKSE